MESFTSEGVELPNSDLTIISSDGIKFHVHKSRLANASEVFDAMLEAGSAESKDVTLVEPAAILARILPFAYPKIVPATKLELPDDLALVNAIKKYEVRFKMLDRWTGIVLMLALLFLDRLHEELSRSLTVFILATQAAKELEGYDELVNQWSRRILPFTKDKSVVDIKVLLDSVAGVDSGLTLQLTVLEEWWRGAEKLNLREDVELYAKSIPEYTSHFSLRPQLDGRPRVSCQCNREEQGRRMFLAAKAIGGSYILRRGTESYRPSVGPELRDLKSEQVGVGSLRAFEEFVVRTAPPSQFPFVCKSFALITFFRLQGTLSYSFNPTSPIRDSVLVSLAYVRANRKQRTFHIDNGSSVMHCKALTEEDFDKWTNALKGFIGTVQKGPLGAEHDLGEEANGAPMDLETVRNTVEEMGHPIQDLEAIHAELLIKHNDAAPISSSSSASSQPTPVHTPNQSPAKFQFLKGGSKRRQTVTATSEDYFDPRTAPPPLPSHSPSVLPEHIIRQLGVAVHTLKAQHDKLLETINSAAFQASFVHAHSPSFTESRSTTPVPLRTYASRSSAAFYPSRSGSASRASSITSGETNEEYYEPEEGYDIIMPGEFVLEEDEDVEGGSSSESEHQADEEADEKSFDTVEEADEEEQEEEKKERMRNRKEGASEMTTMGHKVEDVVRRAQLPAPIAGDEFSMLGMLRKNVGKDLSAISFPVTMNEPLSALQRVAEDFEYADLLHRAASTNDPMERLTLVTTFAISGASSNKYRSSRKPFNPLLGETYECIRPDKGFKFVSEKVSHHPPVLSFHTEGRGWLVDGYVAPSQKFWGRSMEIFMHGDYKVSFPDSGDVYSIKRPSSFVFAARNLVAGTKYLEVVGDLVVTNESTGAKSVVNFKEGSTWGGASTRNKIEGKVFDPNGTPHTELVGRWDEHVDKKEGRDSYQRLWRIGEFPPHAEKYYGFSKFAVQLNETTAIEEGNIPASDSRLRPDQLALEAGDVDLAEETKKRVEEKQRMKRKDAEHPLEPKFFVQDGEGWKFGGDYFKLREQHAFVDPDIF
ncbi:oxysterol-binding protein-related protein 3/6/7, partial [Phenoliferia sp. Uapishka_3]